MSNKIQKLPTVDQLLTHPKIQKMVEIGYPLSIMVVYLRKQLAISRQAMKEDDKCPGTDEIVVAAIELAEEVVGVSLRPVINATGDILHNNLGRAPLSEAAINAMRAVAMGYSNLEFDLAKGMADSQQAHIEGLLCEITGAEAEMVVNNIASAMLLALSVTAKGKEVILPRQQSTVDYNFPEVIRQSGGKAVAVGATVRDYENAIKSDTAVLLSTSSKLFSASDDNGVSIKELVTLGKKRHLPIFDVNDSGCLLDTTIYELTAEPMVQDSVSAGAALVFFSGDKLVGGPQAGIIVGKREYIEKLKKHPLAPTMQIDKMRLAALIVTLLHYMRGEVTTQVPIWRMVAASLQEIEYRAMVWRAGANGLGVIIPGECKIGNGTLPTRLLAIKGKAVSVEKLARALCVHAIPVVGRVEKNILLLDPRSVLPEDDENVKETLLEITGRFRY